MSSKSIQFTRCSPYYRQRLHKIAACECEKKQTKMSQSVFGHVCSNLRNGFNWNLFRFFIRRRKEWKQFWNWNEVIFLNLRKIEWSAMKSALCVKRCVMGEWIIVRFSTILCSETFILMKSESRAILLKDCDINRNFWRLLRILRAIAWLCLLLLW